MPTTTPRRFQVVGRPYYTAFSHRFFGDYSETLQSGSIVTSTGRPDEDGDLLVETVDGVTESVAIACLVEIDLDGYPVTGPSEDDYLSALAPLAVVILGPTSAL